MQRQRLADAAAAYHGLPFDGFLIVFRCERRTREMMDWTVPALDGGKKML